uniref:WDGH domain-containing protein n=1 Tax=viral metagenome TaxID=1070528 RepID=A0A6M3L483_9ZZZZ
MKTIRKGGGMEKVTIEVTDLTKVSDGYHTIEELYSHRCLLWINLCLCNIGLCYVKENHYPGWFLLGMITKEGQISYHCPNQYLYLVKNKIRKDKPDFDGHTPADVLERLETVAKTKDTDR